MKRTLSLLLTTVLLMVFLFPVSAFALNDRELENAISTAKTMLNITGDYDTFTYSVTKQDEKTVYNLSWNDSKQKLGEIYVSIDSTGRLLNYSSYKPYDGRISSKLPSVSKSEALAKSNAFVNRIAPELYSKVRYQEVNTPLNINDTSYHFYYQRIENDVLFPANSINVSVDNRTGEVVNYSCGWIDGLTFPDLSSMLTLEAAQQKFKENIGLKLIYKLSYDGNEARPYLAYNILNSSSCIDAKTGEVVTTGNIYYGGENAAAKSMDMALGAANRVKLSPEETKAVENASSFITEKAAEDTIRRILQLDASYKLVSINLYKVYQSKSDYTWNMYFSTENSEMKPYTMSANASVDAKTGEVIDFYISVPYDSSAEVKYNKEQAQKYAEDFMKSLQPDKSEQVEYTTWGEPEVRPLDTTEQPRQYSFTYTRMSNGVYFPGNGFNITVDSTTGSVINYSFTWYKEALPSPNSVISLDAAHISLFGNIGLKLQYIADYSHKIDKKGIMPPPQRTIVPDIKLVYIVDPSKSVNIDAMTGNLLDYSGKPYVERTISSYNDISGDTNKDAIVTLAQFGISLPGSEFKPNQAISQREFLYMLGACTGWYSNFEVSDEFDDTLYNYMSSLGVVKDAEKIPSSVVSKQDTAKYIIRLLRYDRVAELNGLFSLPFSDSERIENGNIGYVAIASGFGIIKADSSNNYNPYYSITRSDAASYLYNLLKSGF